MLTAKVRRKEETAAPKDLVETVARIIAPEAFQDFSQWRRIEAGVTEDEIFRSYGRYASYLLFGPDEKCLGHSLGPWMICPEGHPTKPAEEGDLCRLCHKPVRLMTWEDLGRPREGLHG